MANVTLDPGLQTELQEVYMQATHWQQDISFLQTETHFFRNIISRYQASANDALRKVEFEAKIAQQEARLVALENKIPGFLAFLKPYIEDAGTEISLDFLTRYNDLREELDTLFAALHQTKKQLFQYTESIMAQPKASKANL